MTRTASLAGLETYSAVDGLNCDILFFSSQSVNRKGIISDSTEEETYVRKLMLECAKIRVFLCDSGKFDSESVFRLTSVNDIDYVIFDKHYDGAEFIIKSP